MSEPNPGRIDPATLKAWLRDGGEVAVLDVREHGQYGEGHLFAATPLPYSRLEADIERLVPRRSVRLVMYDDGLSGIAELAARRVGALGYAQVAILGGGTAAWERAGFALFEGVNVPCKTFGELTEHAYEVPSISAEDLEARRARGDNLVVVDGRPLDEYRKMSIPGAVSCPNGELVYRIKELAPDPATTIVVNCAGRTRSLVGAQILRSFGIDNPVMALRNGTQGWNLSGLTLQHGASGAYPPAPTGPRLDALQREAAAFAERHGVSRGDAARVRSWLVEEERTTYVLDVRTPEEFAAGHLAIAVHAPGGQALQALDQWVAVRGARIVLVDDTEVRATVIAHWLGQLGWETHVLRGGQDAWPDLADMNPPDARAPSRLPELPIVPPTELAAILARGEPMAVVDVRSSAAFRKGHIAGAVWSIRPRAGELNRRLPQGAAVILVADEPLVARAFALDLGQSGREARGILLSPEASWSRAGLVTEASPGAPPDAERIDFLFFVHDRHEGSLEAARQYLAWEMGLVGMLDADERASYRLAAPH